MKTTITPKTTDDLDFEMMGWDEKIIVKAEDGIYRIRKVADTDYDNNPRENDDGFLGTMYCWHSRYSLGDKHTFDTPRDFIIATLFNHVNGAPYYGKPVIDAIERGDCNGLSFLDEVEEDTGNNVRSLSIRASDGSVSLLRHTTVVWPRDPKDIPDWFIMDCIEEMDFSDILSILESLDDICILPLWLYDHSGITMSVGDRVYPYNDRWDSCQVGWVFCTREKFQNLIGPIKEGENWKDKAEEIMEAEVKMYDIYLCGEVFGVIIEKLIATDEDVEEGEDLTDLDDSLFENTDSCWGFFYAQDGEEFVRDSIGDDFEIWPFEYQLPKGPNALAKDANTEVWSMLRGHLNHKLSVRQDDEGRISVVCTTCRKVLLDENIHNIVPNN